MEDHHNQNTKKNVGRRMKKKKTTGFEADEETVLGGSQGGSADGGKDTWATDSSLFVRKKIHRSGLRGMFLIAGNTRLGQIFVGLRN